MICSMVHITTEVGSIIVTVGGSSFERLIISQEALKACRSRIKNKIKRPKENILNQKHFS